MTAIAGLAGILPAASLETACRASLERLQLYGSRQSLRVTQSAAFGTNLWPLTPEDAFDAQPYANERFLLVADVRLDNRDELLRALGRDGRGARCSDAELLFHCWCRWEDRCLDRIVGDYALAVHDAKARTLFLARDPIGQRPLFYAQTRAATLFASMPSGLLPHVGCEHDKVRMAQRLAARENETDLSYFEGVRRLLSGELVTVSRAGVERRRYAASTDRLRGGGSAELAGELEQIFCAAVHARLRRTVAPVATQLSSGYDSSAVTAACAELAGATAVTAFTSAPGTGLPLAEVRGYSGDESAPAAETARMLGVRHEIVRSTGPLLDCLRDHTRYYQEPVRNGLNQSWWGAIDRLAAASGASALLTGETGNVSFSAGGLAALSDWVEASAWRDWLREALAARRTHGLRWRGIAMASFRFHLPRWVREELVHLFVRQPRWASACFARRELLDRLPDEPADDPRNSAAERLSIFRGLDPGVPRKGALAKYRIDERDPTADRRLFEFSLGLAPEHRLRNGIYKPLARAFLSSRVPAAVLDAPVRGYQGADWIARFDQAEALAIVEQASANATAEEVIDLPRLHSTILAWPRIRHEHGARVEAFGRHVTNALAMAVFIAESEDQRALGR